MHYDCIGCRRMKFSVKVQLIVISVICIIMLLIFKYPPTLENRTSRNPKTSYDGPEKQNSAHASVKNELPEETSYVENADVIQLASQQNHAKVVKAVDDVDPHAPEILPGVTWNLPGGYQGYKKERVKKLRLDIPACTKSGHKYLRKLGKSADFHKNETNQPVEEEAPKERMYLSPPGPATALASKTGSGNTWTRHLLEELTGIYSGSMYGWSLLKKYFPGEGVQNGKVIAVKIHETVLEKFDRAIILTRNPYDAFVAEANRQSSGHVGHVSGDVFQTEEWADFVYCHISYWPKFHETWMTFRKPMMLLRYEDLKSDLKGQLRRLVHFLKVPLAPDAIERTVANSEGQFHRNSSGQGTIRLYSKKMQTLLNTTIDYVEKILANKFDRLGFYSGN